MVIKLFLTGSFGKNKFLAFLVRSDSLFRKFLGAVSDQIVDWFRILTALRLERE